MAHTLCPSPEIEEIDLTDDTVPRRSQNQVSAEASTLSKRPKTDTFEADLSVQRTALWTGPPTELQEQDRNLAPQ